MFLLEAATHRLTEPFQKDGLVTEKPDSQGLNSGKSGLVKWHSWWEKGETHRSGKILLLIEEGGDQREAYSRC